jgi:hypothetical protein
LLILAPRYSLALTGSFLSVIAIIGQRRIWWLGIPGLLLNGLRLLVVGVLAYQRYR